MKLLFDQNLSPRLVSLLAEVYPGSVHVHQFTIVAKDWDFQQLSFRFGHPPKVLLLRIGNCSVRDSALLLRERWILIRHFHENSDAALLTLGG